MPPKDKEKNELEITYGGADGVYKIDNWVPNDGAPNVGTATTSATVDSMDPMGMEMSYSFGELDGQMSFDYEGDLRKKYPALKDAWNHYQNVKQMCETREKEEDGS
jgi:hypothetical protein